MSDQAGHLGTSTARHLELPESEVLHLIALAEAGEGDIYRRIRRLERPTLRGRLLGEER